MSPSSHPFTYSRKNLSILFAFSFMAASTSSSNSLPAPPGEKSAVPRFAVDAQEPRGEFRPVPVGELVNPVLDFVQRHDRTITLSANERNCGPRRIPLATRRPWP